MDRLRHEGAVQRLWRGDTSLFSTDPKIRHSIGNRLGWLGLASEAKSLLPRLSTLAEEASREEVSDVVLLGMGGSSLAPLVMSQVLCGLRDGPVMHVLDTTSPERVLDVLDTVDPAHTRIVVASKSGTTIEPLSLYAVFRAWLSERVGPERAGASCVAVTDPGTPLMELARRDGFRHVFQAPADVGGRFSALSAFGLVPAAMLAIDVEELVTRGRAMEQACRQPAESNPAASLAAFIVDAYGQRRDKLTVAASSGLEAFALWAEQLVAESTGKQGVGIVPVPEEYPSTPAGYGGDRMVATVRFSYDDQLGLWAQGVVDSGTPAMDLALRDCLDLAAEFVRWEMAVALVGHLMVLNPFDEPNVSEAKAATVSILEGASSAPAPSFSLGDVEVTYAGPCETPAASESLTGAVQALVRCLRPGDYLAALVYLPEDERYLRPLREALSAFGKAAEHATMLELGPRYLHSTGQLHKGGPNSGVFLMLTTRHGADVRVPGKDYTLGRLFRAQAEGDLLTLAAHGRRVMRIDLPLLAEDRVSAVAEALSSVVAHI